MNLQGFSELALLLMLLGGRRRLTARIALAIPADLALLEVCSASFPLPAGLTLFKTRC